MIATLLVLAGMAMLSALSVLVVRRMIARGVMDVPGARSSHDRPTPKGGGWGILAALLAGIAGEIATGLAGADAVPMAVLGVAALLLGTVSWADDVVQFGFLLKLAAQLVAAMIVILGGFAIDRIGPHPTGAWGIPLSLAWLVFAINAVNFIDGLNGLASGCALVAAVAIAAAGAAIGADARGALLACLPLACGIAGFLPFNFPAARVFMGDVGSQVLGLVLAAMAGPLSAPPAPGSRAGAWGALVVPICLAPILADVAFTLCRRALAGRRIVEAHRGHLYQLVRRAGRPAPGIALAYVGMTAVSAGLALASILRGGRPLDAVLAEAALIAAWTAAALVVARRAPIGPW